MDYTELADATEKLLPKCAAGQLSKALGTALQVIDKMVDAVGAQAGRRAQDIIEVWGDADPHWSQFGKVYNAKDGEEPFECIQRFIMPAIEKWMRQYWAALTAETPVAIDMSLEESLRKRQQEHYAQPQE